VFNAVHEVAADISFKIRESTFPQES
jgi:hypothetical protein